MIQKFALIAILLATTWAAAQTVDCDAGQSLNRTLAKMSKSTPSTVVVKGTCTEYVQIDGFDGLTLKGVQGATLRQPNTDPKGGNGGIYVVSILASRSVTISGFAIHSRAGASAAIGVGEGSVNVQLRNLTVDSGQGILIYQASQVSIAKVNITLAMGWAAISAYDLSDVHIEDCAIDRATSSGWDAGLAVGSAHVTMHGTTIRDMQTSIVVGTHGSVDVVDFGNIYPLGGPSDVVIDNPAGGNFNGVIVSDGSSFNVGTNAALRITNAGQPWGWDTGAVFVSNNSTFNAGANLVVSGSHGQGVMVSNNSTATFGGSSIAGSAKGGLVVVNGSTATVGSSNPLTAIYGNGTADLFCDSKSQIYGSTNIVNAATVQCANLVPGAYENLP